MQKARQRQSWRWNAPLQFDLSRAEIVHEILAGIMGWQTVVTSFASYAGIFVNDDDLDKNATAEMFMLVAGVSTIMFGLSTDLPFLVAPSVLYAARETGITMGGQLAAQALANAAATVVFACAVRIKLVSYIPTALRIGAGCGVAMLVGVLGMRSVGLLVADTFVLPPFTWETAVGLAVVTVASMTAPPQLTAYKWIYVLVVPLALTVAVYAIVDTSKFQGYSSEERLPLSNWKGGTFWLVDVSAFFDAPKTYALYIVRMILSIVINISSILLVLIDTVCLQRVRGLLRSAGETDFSDAIGGTTKFRRMACAIPMMSFIGNLAGVTTQAAFVESMIIVFAGGKTGLSAVVTGFLFILTMAIWPLLPVLVPAHISGALTIVVTLRFFTVIRMIDVTHPSNLLMFGVPILLVPFSFDFVDAICVATLIGFVCGFGNHIMSCKTSYKEVKVAKSNLEGGVTQDVTIKEYEDHRRPKITRKGKKRVLRTIGDGDSSNSTSLLRIGSKHSSPGTPLPVRTCGVKGLLLNFTRHKLMPGLPAPLMMDTSQTGKEEANRPEAERQGAKQRNYLRLVLDIFSGFNLRRSRSSNKGLVQSESSVNEDLAEDGAEKGFPQSQASVEVLHDGRVLSFSTPDSLSVRTSLRQSTSREPRHVEVDTPPKLHNLTESIARVRSDSSWKLSEIGSENGPTVHWKLAVVAVVELALKVMSDQLKG